ncbi:hypothetical protein AVEN_23761-1 [Araneus ventricosus]|uniref:Uncharacterized protein n=1 Tax=Araneus ventricosus TaxID=182803 RepID=A0A4Y2W359_ARAVE|nr:hypothetical protein AVEN_23761-1 [Araneus ventricosus]
MDILMLKEGKVKDRFYMSKDLQNSNLVIECKKSIHFLHAISGCDTTSSSMKENYQQCRLFNTGKSCRYPEIFITINQHTEIERAGEFIIIVATLERVATKMSMTFQ